MPSEPGHSDDAPLLLTVRQVCKLLNRSRARIYALIASHEIKHIRDGKSVLIPRDALDDWIRKKRRQNGC